MTNSPTVRLRRSMLFTPGANQRAMRKAKSLAADMLAFDLEDAVAPIAKESARKDVLAMIAAGGFGHKEILVRINAISSPWGKEDVEQAVKAGAKGVIAAKLATPDEVVALNRLLDAAGADRQFGLWAMIETPLAILNLHEIVKTSKATRLCGLILGVNDLLKDLRARDPRRDAVLAPAMSSVIFAARAYGLCAIDGVYNDIKDSDGFLRECEQGRGFGFDGKSLIHPGQIEDCNRTFSPTDSELVDAQRIIEAFDRPENAGLGVIAVDGKMVERLHLADARRTVEISAAIKLTARQS